MVRVFSYYAEGYNGGCIKYFADRLDLPHRQIEHKGGCRCIGLFFDGIDSTT
jgi:hypothetical protein